MKTAGLQRSRTKPCKRKFNGTNVLEFSGGTLKIQNPLFPLSTFHAMSAGGNTRLMGAAGGGGGGGGGDRAYKSFVDPDAPVKGL